MGILKGRNSAGQWVTASAVYGWNSSGVKTYAKALFTRKSDGTWDRSWTDCRKFDEAGGRDWSAPSTVVTYSGSCGNRTETTTVTRTKEGCTADVRSTTVASPNCTSGCYDPATVTEEYFDGSCATRRFRTKTVTNPKAGSNCPSSTTYSAPYAAPTCEGACTTAKTGDFTQNSVTYYYEGTPGYYYALGCDINAGCFGNNYYYVTTCSGTNNITLYQVGPCYNAFGDPC